MFGAFTARTASRASTYFTSTSSFGAFRLNTTQLTPATQPKRKMGVMDFVTNKIEQKKTETQLHKEREQFRDMRDYLISCPKYRFREHLAYIETQVAKVSKTDRLIGGQDVKVAEEAMKRKINIFKAFTPLEVLQDSPAAINMAAKSRIHLATGVDKPTIQAELNHFDQMKSMHTWLTRRLKDGKTLPEDQLELQLLMRADPPPPTHQQVKFIKKQQNAMRRGPRY